MELPQTKTPNANPLGLWDVISILLGIIIGVAAVIVMMALGNGARTSI